MSVPAAGGSSSEAVTMLAQVTTSVAPAIAATGLLLAIAVVLTTRSLGTAVQVLLDLLLAAGLLRFSGAASWEALGSAAVLVLVRHLAGRGIRSARSQSRPAAE